MREAPLRAEIALLSEAYTASAQAAMTILQTSFRSADTAGRERLFAVLLMDWLAMKGQAEASRQVVRT